MTVAPLHGASFIAVLSHLHSRRPSPGSSFVIVLGLLLVLPFYALQTVEAQENSAAALAAQGRSALERGDFDSAAQLFQQAQHLAPDNAQVATDLLLSYVQSGRIPNAISFGQQASRHWPNNPELHHYLGLAQFKAGQNDAAAVQLQQAAKLDPAPSIRFDLGLVKLAQQNYAAAAEDLQQVIRSDKSNALAHLLLGRAYQNSNRSVPAIEEFRTALKLDPNVPLGHYNLGFAYASLGKNADAVTEYNIEVQRSPNNPEVHYQLGRLLLDAGDTHNAISELQRATALDPNNSDAFYELGKATASTDDARAQQAFRRAIELNPQDPGPHYQLARCLQRNGKNDEARIEMQKFAELKKLEPQSGGMATGRIH